MISLDKLIIIVGIIITIIALVTYTYFIFKFKFRNVFKFLLTLDPKDVLYMLLYSIPALSLMYVCIWLLHLLY